MKKIVGLLTACVVAAAALAGCGSAAGNASSTGSAESAVSESRTAVSETSAASEAESSAASANGGKVLVMYYSASGNTKNIADMIAADTGADEYEVTPAEPYTDDDLNWSDENSRVVKEHEDESLQDVAFDSYDIPNWDSYDTVFVGYPIWWQDASWVMKSFVKNVDFSGKTVIPFCTSSASDIGESGNNLAQLAGSGDWQEGQRFSGSASADEVQEWVNGLGF